MNWKKIVSFSVLAGVMATGTVLANPFDDVPAGHWSYDAVQMLAKEGIIDGYGDKTFHGDRLMTRYEMAQIVGRAVSRQKFASPADKDVIGRLSKEYAEELDALGVRVSNLEKQTAGVKDLKISHWMQTENTYGDTTAKLNDKAHEYELEYRLTAEKQISPKLGAIMQIETQTYWDTDNWRQERSDDGVYSRLAYLTYKPEAKTVFLGGKNAYWFAGGLLGDDFISGVSVSHQFNERTAALMTYGYYNGSQRAKNEDQLHSIITYGEVTSRIGKINVGAHYLTGSKGLANKADHSRIWAITAGKDLGQSGVNLSGGYGVNTAEENNNKMLKVQLYKKVGLTDTFLQYWKQQSKLNLPLENGNHLTWWGDEYNNNGHDGYRLILGHPVSQNCYAEAWYGIYNNLTNDETGRKFGWALTFSY